jgi:Raf kinase inhibitor-like YbhB/YbcL family protein
MPMSPNFWRTGFVAAIAIACGMGAKPIAVCLRTPTTYRSIDAVMYRSIDSSIQRSNDRSISDGTMDRWTDGPIPASVALGQRGGGRGAVQVMTLTTAGWTDGGAIALKYTQAGEEVSPPLAWSGAPTPTTSFVLIVHDIDAMRGNDDMLHWLVWNIPGTATGLPEHVPHGPELPGGMRQISATGPYYRGPAAPASGPAHHYVFELYALDTTIDVQPAAASPAETRAAVVAAMAGHIRGKASLVGLYKRGS